METLRRPILAAALLAACGCAAPRDDAWLATADGRVPVRRGPGARMDEAAPRPAGGAVAPEVVRATWFPRGPLLYEPYLAAPRQSRTSVKLQLGAGENRHPRLENTIGFQRPVVRWTSEEEAAKGRGTELEFEAAVFARFDLHEKYDMDASDWRFGFPLVHRDGDFAWKLHLSHLTSHLGDEYIQRTKEQQEPYHIEEAAAGVSWDATAGSRLYGEAATALYAGEPAEGGRLQAGWEWVGRKGTSGFAPYAAADVQVRREQEWTPATTLAVGLAYGRDFRFGLEYFSGRDPQTQFLLERVRYLSIGVSLDL